jgi:MutS domain V
VKALLMHPDRDFDTRQVELPPDERDGRVPRQRGQGAGTRQVALSPNEPDLAQDLELDTLLHAMAAGDKFLFDVARAGLHSGLTSPEEIVYRQHVLADCIAQPGVVRDLYQIAVTALTEEKKIFGWIFRDSPETILHRSRQVMELFVKVLRVLRETAAAHAAAFRSEGFTRFFTMIAEELTDEYFADMEAHLAELAFRRGTLISARLGKGVKGTGYVLRRQPETSWRDRLPGVNRNGYTFTIPERDENGFRALSDLVSYGTNDTANAVAQACDHIRGFFGILRAELGFYIGCLNLRDRLTGKGEPVCFPDPAGLRTGKLAARGLYDPCLSLKLAARAVGNDVAADGKTLVMVTGANQGGKSTFLRSAGLAQLMIQAGMFVAAESFAASVTAGVFTHFKREEDATMEKGKLDEELERMSVIAGQIRPGALLLCNESFASTNEREGSQIAREVIRALTEAGIRVLFVTHLYDLAHGCYSRNDGTALFLRAQRRPDGTRTFRLLGGEPLPTSYGEDLYRQVFGTAYETAPA